VSDQELRNALKYALLALLAFGLGCATALVPQLMDPAMAPINWRIVVGTGITAIVTAYGGSRLPRSGSTAIASQVDALKAQGVPRHEMVVVSQDEAVSALAATPDPAAVQAVADELERRRRARVEATLQQRSGEGGAS
jgi:hypothetical protein